jgi:hypothetical protein
MFSGALAVLYTMLQLVVLAGLGVFLRRGLGWPPAFFRRLSRLFVRVVLPVYFFVRMARVDLDVLSGALVFPLAAIAFVLISLGLSTAAFTLLGMRGAERRSAVAMGSFGNSGYIPITITEIFPLTYPLIAEVIDPNIALVYIGTYVFAYSPLLWSLGNFIITGSGTRLRLRDLISPPLIGISLGLLVPILGLGPLLFDESLPLYHIFSALDRLSALTLPLALISLGAIIGGIAVPKSARGNYGKLAAGVAVLRFVAYPGLFFLLYALLLRRMNVSPVVLWVLFLETAVPPANNLAIMTSNAGRNENYAGFSLLVNYSLYVFALPILLILFLSLPEISGG